MDDDDQPNKARILNGYLGSVTIQRIKLPDLNPIEHAQDILQQRNLARPTISQYRHSSRLRCRKYGIITFKQALHGSWTEWGGAGEVMQKTDNH